MNAVRWSLIGVGMVAAVSVTAPAIADETFDNFQNLCFATNGDSTKSIAAADKAGWMALPQTLLDQINEQSKASGHTHKLDSAQARMRSNSKSLQILLVADDASMVTDFHAHMCFVASAPASVANFDEQIATLADVPESQNFREGMTAYVWRVTDGHHVQVTRGDPDLKSQFENGLLTMIVTRHDTNIAGIALVTPMAENDATTTPGNTSHSDTK